MGNHADKKTGISISASWVRFRVFHRPIRHQDDHRRQAGGPGEPQEHPYGGADGLCWTALLLMILLSSSFSDVAVVVPTVRQLGALHTLAKLPGVPIVCTGGRVQFEVNKLKWEQTARTHLSKVANLLQLSRSAFSSSRKRASFLAQSNAFCYSVNHFLSTAATCS